jgi:hypothetical protein
MKVAHEKPSEDLEARGLATFCQGRAKIKKTLRGGRVWLRRDHDWEVQNCFGKVPRCDELGGGFDPPHRGKLYAATGTYMTAAMGGFRGKL